MKLVIGAIVLFNYPITQLPYYSILILISLLLTSFVAG